ncbi:TonB-dependent receptor [Brevundimonas sp.]|uniref:TonB-dependent receptor n=1 Tax=Brevundimonas sp. TaxID=1871086 RepID=UPI00286A1B83|nr:TonB-dependent receptor [Brevundimonas sp.]
MLKGVRGRALLLAGAAWAAGGGAIAQDQLSQDATTLDEVVVTATKRGQTVLEAPVSVSVVTSETIKNTGATNFSELATLIPSVVFSTQQSPVQANVGMRGVTTAGGSAALEPSVGIYVDGVFTDRTSIGIGDFNDLAAVEVLRGPQSTLFGNASPAGIINFVTQDPGREFSGELRGTVGNFNRRQFAATVTGPLVADTLFGRVSVFSHQRDGYLDNLIGPDSNDQNAYGLRAKLLYAPTGPLRVLGTVEYSEIDQNCCVPVHVNVPDALLNRFATASTNFPFVGSGVPFPRNQLDSQTVAVDGLNTYEQSLLALTLRVDYAFESGHRLTSIGAYRSVDQFSSADIDFTGLNLLNFPGVQRDNQHFSQEIRLASPEDRPVTWLIGAYAFQKEVTEDSALVISPQTAALLGGNVLAQNSPSFNSITNRNFALFGEATWGLSDRLSVTGGLRWNFDDKQINAFAARLRANGAQLSPTQFIPADKQQRDGGELTGRVVVEYAFNDDLRTFGSYTRGYKAFGINDDANLIRNIPGADFFFDSEIVDNYEIGLKGQLAFWDTDFSVVAFRSEYDDFQALSSFIDSTNTLRFYLQNAASLISQGLEVDATARPIDGLTFTLAATYLDAAFDSFPNAQGPSGVVDLSGRPLTDAPEWSASAVIRYERPIGAGLRVFAQADVFYRTSVFTELTYDPVLRQEPHTKINARIGLGDQADRWTLELWGRNLTDEITFGRGGRPVFGAVTAVLPAGGAPSFPVGNTYIKYTGEPRTYGATLTYRF